MSTAALSSSTAPQNVASLAGQTITPANIADLIKRTEPESFFPALGEGRNDAITDAPHFASTPIVVSNIVSGLLDEFPEGVRDFIPEKEVTSLNVAAVSVHFNRATLDPVPSRGTFRLKTHKRRTKVGNLERYGAGIEEDSDVFLTEEGTRMHELKLVQLVKATNTIQMTQIMENLLESGTQNDSYSYRHKDMSNPVKYARVHADRAFAFQKNMDGWISRLDELYAELTRGRGVQGVIGMIVPFDYVDRMSRTYYAKEQNYSPKDNLLSISGVLGREPAMVTQNGVRIYAAPSLSEFDEEDPDWSGPQAYQILTRETHYAEHVVAPAWTEVDDFNDGQVWVTAPRFRSRNSNLLVNDTTNDKFILLTRKQLLLDLGGMISRPYIMDVYSGRSTDEEKAKLHDGSAGVRLPFYYARALNEDGKLRFYRPTIFGSQDSEVFDVSDVKKMAQTFCGNYNENSVASDSADEVYAKLAETVQRRIENLRADEGDDEGQREEEPAPARRGFASFSRSRFFRAGAAQAEQTGALSFDEQKELSNYKNLEKEIDATAYSDAFKNLMKAFIDFPFTRGGIEWLINENVYMPYPVLVSWPRIIFNMDSIVMAAMGRQTGEMLYAMPSVQQANDPNNHTTLTTFSVFFHVMIYQTKNIITDQNVGVRGYVGGGGVKPYSFDTFQQEYNRTYDDQSERPSIIAHVLTKNEEGDMDVIPSAGYFATDDDSNGRHSFRLSSAHVFCRTGLRLVDHSVNFTPVNPFQYEVAPAPLVSFASLSAHSSPYGGIVINKAKGPRGPNAVYPGAGRVYRNAKAEFVKEDEIENYLKTLVENSGLLK